MNTLSNLKMPRAVCCGEGALKKMPEILQAASVKKAAVFTDKGIRSAGLLDPVLEQLQKSQAAFCVLDDLRATARSRSWWMPAGPRARI